MNSSSLQPIHWQSMIPTTQQQEINRQKIIKSLLIIGALSALFCIINYKSIFSFLKTKLGIILSIIISLLIIYAHIEPFFYHFAYREISVSKHFQSFIAIQISDVHFQWPYPYISEKKLNKIVERINQIQPDFIFLTGDMISRWRTHSISQYNTDTISRIFSKLKAKRQKIAILGNNDICAKSLFISAIKRAGFTLLIDSTINDSNISITGLSTCHNFAKTQKHLSKINISKNEDDILRILLVHEPDVADIAHPYFDLQLSGHTHGGQCVIPFGIGPIFTPRMGRKYPIGLYQIKNMLLYVSVGLGISPLPKPLVRFNNIAEIAVLHIVPK